METTSIDELFRFDKSFKKYIIGTDEAGRGPGAGGVFASAVYFPEKNSKPRSMCAKFRNFVAHL